MTALSTVFNPEPTEVASAIHAGLRAHNELHVGPPNPQPFAIFVRDEHGVAIGGLEGRLRWGWLYVDHLWLPDHLRGTGIGSRLIREAESIARQHGCTGSYLETFEFQARGFYEKLGYTLYGVLEGFPAGSRRYSFCKVLPQVASESETE